MSDISQPTVRFQVEDVPLSPELRARLAGLLRDGRVLCLPTETVYGLAVRADRPEALAALRAIKGQESPRPFTWHIAGGSALESFEFLRPLAQRLAERYWPGPLTLVLDGVPPGLAGAAHGDSLGVRVPAHAATLDLLAAVGFPVVMTSLNLAGGAPATSLEGVSPALLAGAAAVLDGGPARLGEASAVLRLGRGVFEVLRPGVVSLQDLQRTAGLTIGFCCTGNTCRSPMAEGLAKGLLAERLGSQTLADFGFSVESMGVFAHRGAPAAANAVEALVRLGVAPGCGIEDHRSQPALPERLAELDRVYCLTSSHLDVLTRSLPPSGAAHVELLDPGGRDIPDPIGGALEEYLDTARVIRDALSARASDWA